MYRIYKLVNDKYKSIWSYVNSNLQNKNFAPFLISNYSFLDENELDVNEGVLELTKCDFSIFDEEIRQYFPDLKDFQKFIVLSTTL